MDSICVAAVTGGRNMHIVNLNACAAIELEMGLLAVLNCYATHCHSFTPIKPKRLHIPNYHTTRKIRLKLLTDLVFYFIFFHGL